MELAGELVFVLSQRAIPQQEHSADVVVRAGRSVICGFLSALVVYTGLMFVLWAGVAATCAVLIRQGWSTWTALSMAFLAMGLFWSIAGSLAVWLVLRSLRDMPTPREYDAGLAVHRETSQST
jgi:membrane protein implicated in regulation of membrane protease activity